MDYVIVSENFNSVRNSLKIEEVIANHTTLRKDGRLYFCRCPLHKDDGESMIINPQAGFFYCRECHAGGDVFRFIAMMEKVSIYEASETQAKKINAELSPSRMDFVKQRERTAVREIAEINNFARDFYHEILTSRDEGEECRKFLNSCGISSDAIEEFKLGFAPDAKKKLSAYLYDYDFPLNLMIKTGLIANNETGEFEDKLQHCLVIPIMGIDGNTQKLLGRPPDFDKKAFYETDGVNAEYIETADSPDVSNRELIFGLSAAKNSIVKSGQMLIVAGYLDMIVLRSAGIENVVTVLDLRLSPEQTEEIVKYADQFIFLVKNKQALQMEEYLVSEFLRENKELLVVNFPTSPAKFLQDKGKELFLSKLEEPARIDKYKFFKKIRADIIGMATRQYKATKSGDEKSNSLLLPKIGKTLMGMAFKEAGIFEFLRRRLPKESFSEVHKKLLDYLEVCFEENIKPDRNSAELFLEDEDAINEALELLGEMDKGNSKGSVILEDALRSLERLRNLVRYSKLKKQILESDKVNDEDIIRLMEISKELSEE